MSQTDKATEIRTGVEGLRITVGSDGVWVHFDADGKKAGINLSNYALERGNITGGVIRAWCQLMYDNYQPTPQEDSKPCHK